MNEFLKNVGANSIVSLAAQATHTILNRKIYGTQSRLAHILQRDLADNKTFIDFILRSFHFTNTGLVFLESDGSIDIVITDTESHMRIKLTLHMPKTKAVLQKHCGLSFFCDNIKITGLMISFDDI